MFSFFSTILKSKYKIIFQKKDNGLITTVSGIHKCDETVCIELEEKAEKQTELSVSVSC